MADKGFKEGKVLLCGDYTAYTPSGANLFKSADRWSKTPHTGDIVYFYSSGLGRISHVGAVVAVKKTGITYTITTIEGNTSADSRKFEREGGCSAIHYYSFTEHQVGGTYRIAGFGAPKYGDDTCTKEEFIQVLRSELGYYEKETNAYLYDKLKNVGDENWTKFGAWFASIVGNPIYKNAQWCQMFISYCAFQACRHHAESAGEKAGYTGWIHAQDAKGWYWVYRRNGKNLKGWHEIGGRWWHFKADGKLSVGWLEEGGHWYYLHESSGMIRNDWLYFDEAWYYFKGDGSMMKGDWVYWREKWYYLNSDGKMATDRNILSSGGIYWYYVDESGVWDEKYRMTPK